MPVSNEVREKWRPVHGYEGWYEVSTLGRVRRVAPGAHTRAGKVLKPCDKGSGYMRVTLHSGSGGATRTIAIARLVTDAFLGSRPANMEVNHIDGDKGNNAVLNLEYVTRGDNIRHAFRTGLQNNQGERHPQAKVTEAGVLAIRARTIAGESRRVLAKEYGVTPEAISRIHARQTWRHVA